MKIKYILAVCIAFSLFSTTFIAKAENLNYLTIKGSDTMVNLVGNWAEAFIDKNPTEDISVTGGGTGAGMAALINGTANIAAASRVIKSEELSSAKAKGFTPKEITVARDGITIIANLNNPVKTLTMDQLAKIYTGVYTNWKQVGGANGKIILFSRESSSGTYSFFQEHVLKKQDFTVNAKLLPATSAIIQEVSSTKNAIGYVGLGYADKAKNKVKELAIKKTLSAPAVLPSEKTIRNNAYPISRPLYLYVKTLSNKSVNKFVKFTLSPEGQTIVKESGFVKVN
jgi:phosphate transport system substrate-binding protein